MREKQPPSRITRSGKRQTRSTSDGDKEAEEKTTRRTTAQQKRKATDKKTAPAPKAKKQPRRHREEEKEEEDQSREETSLQQTEEQQPSEQEEEEEADEHEPPQPLVLPAQQCQPLTQEALDTLSQQCDPHSYTRILQQIRQDDRLFELASHRGLLVEFVVKRVTSSNMQPAYLVQAPEYATVNYLRRRIMRARLMQEPSKYLNPNLFVFRRKLVDPSTGAVTGFEELPIVTDAGNEVYLFDLGFKAPGSYEIIMMAAPTTTDREQQQEMLAGGVGPSRPGRNGFMSPERVQYRTILQGSEAIRSPRSEVKPRRPKNPWTASEIEALVEGFQAFGSCWAQIHERFTTGEHPRIHPRRSQIDFKDKWRNLAKLVMQPEKNTRGVQLEAELKTTILRLVMTEGGVGGGGDDNERAANNDGDEDNQNNEEQEQQEEQQQQQQQQQQQPPDDNSQLQ